MGPRLLLCLLLAAAPVFAQQASGSPPDEASATAAAGKEQAWDTTLAKGADLMKAGKPEAAILEAFDPVIAGYEQEYASEKRRVYCARTLAETLLYMGGAVGNKQDAISLQPTWAYAWFMKAYALAELGRPDDAHSALQKALQLSPANPQFLSELGYEYIGGKQWQKALDTYENAEAMVPVGSPDDARVEELTRALRGEGYALTEMGRFDEAEARYRKALQADPGDEKSKGELQYIATVRRDPKAPSEGK